MHADDQLVDCGLRAWKQNIDRVEGFFHGLGSEQLEQEVAPGRNRLIYLWGHLASVHDALFPLLGIGPRLHPELEEMFVTSPDRAVPSLLPADQVRAASDEIHAALWSAFTRWTPAEWVARHTAVSEEDFAREPHRNRFSVLLSRTAHMASHYGQAMLARPRD
jgi:hypothetical protein